MQIQINQIENGWLVMTPPRDKIDLGNGQPHPEVHYCSTMGEVLDYLRCLELGS